MNASLRFFIGLLGVALLAGCGLFGKKDDNQVAAPQAPMEDLAPYAGKYAGSGTFAVSTFSMRGAFAANGSTSSVPVEISFTVPETFKAEKAVDWSKRTGVPLDPRIGLDAEDMIWWVEFTNIVVPVLENGKVVQRTIPSKSGMITPKDGNVSIGGITPAGFGAMEFRFDSVNSATLDTYVAPASSTAKVQGTIQQPDPIPGFFHKKTK